MRKIVLLLFIIPSLLFSSAPSEKEVELATQAVILATAIAFDANNFNYKVFEKGEISFNNNLFFTNLTLTMNNSDVGSLRKTILNQDHSKIKNTSTILEALIPSYPKHQQLQQFIALNTGVGEKEIILDGKLTASLKTKDVLGYYGEGKINFDGKRFNNPFTIDVEFIFPLEGEYFLKLQIPKALILDVDYSKVIERLFYE